MIKLIYSPQWFFGKDIIIDIFSIVILLLLSIYFFRYYKIDKSKKFLMLTSSFSMIALAFVFKIITNFTIYYNILETKQLGFFKFTYQALKSSDILFDIGFLSYRILMLIGLYTLYSIYINQKQRDSILIIYLLIFATIFSKEEYYMFHLTALIFLSVLTYHYYIIYSENKNNANKWLTYSFALITISQILFIFINLNSTIYVIAEIIQLIGYITLFITFIKTINYGKKKRTKRHST